MELHAEENPVFQERRSLAVIIFGWLSQNIILRYENSCYHLQVSGCDQNPVITHSHDRQSRRHRRGLLGSFISLEVKTFPLKLPILLLCLHFLSDPRFFTYTKCGIGPTVLATLEIGTRKTIYSELRRNWMAVTFFMVVCFRKGSHPCL